MIPHANAEEQKQEEDENSIFEYEYTRKLTWSQKLLRDRPSKVVLILLLAGVVTPLILYRYIFFTSVEWPTSDGSFGSCLVPLPSRLLCGRGQVPRSECHPQCCYDMNRGICFHRFPSRFSYIMDQNWTEGVTLRPRVATVPYGSQNSHPNLLLSIDEVSPSHLTLNLYRGNMNATVNQRRIDSKLYNYSVSSPEMNIVVYGPNGPIFDTAQGPLIASDNIWEITFILTSELMFGLGELPLEPGTVKVIYNHNAGISSFPLIFAKYNGTYHGLLIDNHNPTELIVGETNTIILRSITNSGIKLHLFVGPEPKDIMRDVREYIGDNGLLEYWMLGVHICSETSDGHEEALSELQEFIRNATTSRLPFDSHCGAVPIVFKAENDTQEIVSIETGSRNVRTAGKKFVPHVSPYVVYEANVYESTDNETNITDTEIQPNGMCINGVCGYEEFLLHFNSTEVYNGTVLDNQTVYPDYANISQQLMTSLWAYDLQMDAVVLENNWPLDDSEKSFEDVDLPYFGENFESAFENTPMWNTVLPQGNAYFYEHNEYGNKFSDAVEMAVGNITKWSTSQWMRANVVINRQNVNTTWTIFRKELIEAALGGISGHWLWSSPVCGDTEHFDMQTQMSICLKWYRAATYLPMFKIHSKSSRRDPLAFEGMNRAIAMNSITERMSLLPYFWTVLQEGPLLRPMFYQFPSSESLSALNRQFSVGDNLLIAPNLQPDQSHVHIVLPPGTWYEFWSGLQMIGEEGDAVTMTTTESDFLTFIRGGSIVITQRNGNGLTVEANRMNTPFNLVVAIKTVNVTIEDEVTEIYTAEGKFYMAPNMTIHFALNNTSLVVTSEGNQFQTFCGFGTLWPNFVFDVRIYGLDPSVNTHDHHREVQAMINLCQLQTQNSIVSNLIPS